MFGWLSRKVPAPIVFDTNEAAFEYACRHHTYPLYLEALIPSLVIEQGACDADGVCHFLLRLPDEHGFRELWACTLKNSPRHPRVGDFVGFKVVKIASDLPVEASVIGFIAVRLAPEWIHKKGWRVQLSYTPHDIKPTVRW